MLVIARSRKATKQSQEGRVFSTRAIPRALPWAMLPCPAQGRGAHVIARSRKTTKQSQEGLVFSSRACPRSLPWAMLPCPAQGRGAHVIARSRKATKQSQLVSIAPEKAGRTRVYLREPLRIPTPAA